MHKFRHKETPDLNKLWVVTVISNPERYKSRYELFHRFQKRMDEAKVNLMVVELAHGDRPFEVTEENNPNHLQLRSTHEIWSKECMINLGVAKLPLDWKYLCWIDSDISFNRTDWPEETVHLLQQYDVIQMFRNAVDLGPTGEVLKVFDGFVYTWNQNEYQAPEKRKKYDQLGHPGFAWACTREAFNNLGGLIDYAILGAGDRHMAMGLIGKTKETTHSKLSKGYKQELLLWEGRATTHVRKNIGYMDGTIFHEFHGSKQKRFYNERWNILLKHDYDPDLDLKRDWQGLYILTDRGLRMRNDIRNYFQSRDEDNISIK